MNNNYGCNLLCMKNNLKLGTISMSTNPTCYCGFNEYSVLSEQNCWCTCFNSKNQFCGCYNWAHRVYSTRAQNISSMIISEYSGCVENQTESFNFSVHLGYMSNDLCIQICKQKDFIYALTEYG